MNRSLVRKFVRESALLFIACAVGLFAFSWFRVWIVGELDTARFQQIVEMLPSDWRRFSPVDYQWLISYLGRTALTLDEPMLMMLVSAWAIVRGSYVVSGELNRGTLEWILAQPVSRARLYWQHVGMTLGGCLALVLVVWLGMAIGIWTTSVEETRFPEIRIPIVDYRIPLTFLEAQTEVVPMSSEVSAKQFWPGIVNLFSLAFFLTAISAWCSAWDRYRWRTLGLVGGFYFANALVKMLALSSEKYASLRFANVFGFYEPALAIQHVDTQSNQQFFDILIRSQTGELIGLGPALNNLVLLAIGVALLVWGAAIFNRRDLPAPV